MVGGAPSSDLRPDPLPEGVVFDCDGTLADTESLSMRIWTRALAPYGVVPTDEDFAAVIGHAWPRSYERFARRADLGDPEAFRAEVRAVAEQVHATDLRLFDDAVAVLRALTDHGVPVAVASSSSRAHVERCLAIGGLRDHVQVVLGVDDVTAPKPDPEPYRRAAEGLGVAPDRAVAVEDTVTGLTSARAAGLRTVAIARGVVPAASLRPLADRLVTTLTLDAVAIGPR